MSNPEVSPATQKKNRGGRPKGSKNKPKAGAQAKTGVLPALPAAMVQFLPEYLRPQPEQVAAPEPVKVPEAPPIIKDGFPNLPDAKLIGRPFGSKNSTPRKRRQRAQQAASQQETVLQPPVVGLEPPVVETGSVPPNSAA
jgi:hypothetical protein